MLKLLGSLSQYLKSSPIKTESMLFRMHNKLTAVMLLACSAILTATQYVGSPISCIVQGLPEHVVNTYCWITSTFTMPDAYFRQVGKEVAHPGVSNDFGDFSARKYYTYYQWVCFALFFQGVLCWLPQWLWNAWENGLMETIVMGMNLSMDTKENIEKKKNVLMEYLTLNMKRHTSYVYRYFVCEFLCLVNIIGQLYLMNHFLGGEFFSYGTRVLQFSNMDQEKRVDPMVYVFPRMTKCIFHKYGPSGTIQTHDSLCLLPLNVFNEKAYIFFWFWHLLMALLLLGLVVYRLLIIFAPSFRPRLLHMAAKRLPIEICRSVNSKVNLGDWWILYGLAHNMDPIIYREFLAEFVKKISNGKMNI
ncbi:innexin inx1 [Harpegnathos saltator]|uniref:Innexin n=1 Tax=Harpegnathos saltator TaxID=610380 RepID=E2BMI3_HARSA|nr:innexin inx1 [Harpegnathos saltator]EFN83092.1 Innexin inx1 [Harpegnathos saltator]